MENEKKTGQYKDFLTANNKKLIFDAETGDLTLGNDAAIPEGSKNVTPMVSEGFF